MTGLGLRRRVGSESENEKERSVGMHFSSVAILIFSLLSMPFFSESIKLFLWFLCLLHLYLESEAKKRVRVEFRFGIGIGREEDDDDKIFFGNLGYFISLLLQGGCLWGHIIRHVVICLL